jgi:hypothetical protein
MKIALVLNSENSGWIIEKITFRLRDELNTLGHTVVISNSKCADADVNHFMSYNFVEPSAGISTAMVTHIDDVLKLQHLKKLISGYEVNSLICMSAFTRELLISQGLPAEKISYVLPSVDSSLKVKKIKIGLSGRIYKDGRKNERWLIAATQKISLENFQFYIFGSGWERVESSIVSSGGKVFVYPESSDYLEDYNFILSKLNELDYWMYLGFDEGSLGTIDAALAAVPLIVTPQGFHLELPSGIDYPVSSEEDLVSVLRDLDLPLRLSSAAGTYWSWSRYALDHVAIWSGDFAYTPFLSSKNSINDSLKYFRFQSLTLRRLLSGIARTPFILGVRRFLRLGK